MGIDYEKVSGALRVYTVHAFVDTLGGVFR
jgi:hypothetical protein